MTPIDHKCPSCNCHITGRCCIKCMDEGKVEESVKGWETTFDELLSHYKDTSESTNYAVNVMRRQPNSVLENEIKSFIRSTLEKEGRLRYNEGYEEGKKVR